MSQHNVSSDLLCVSVHHDTELCATGNAGIQNQSNRFQRLAMSPCICPDP